ncbi:hypothetical protein F5148DRAFT_1000135 [Russula earlei]|uniref:Uncharacterized protein n=1 Tax=Russula earlei TaxID=71964 RepID=A0ACC0U5B7_9AGAM|nr:hypothetical protein F5148DRAFT_1000135 [Russula earlei]
MKNDATEAALGLLNLADAAKQYSTIPSKRAAPQDDEQPHAAGSDTINCICGYSFDDGFSIACDDCSRWCHAACFEIVQGGVPEEWRCWICAPRPVDRERAVRLQTQRKHDAIRAESEKRRRQCSPGVDRKHRRQNALAVDSHNSRRKRRASVNVQPIGEDEHVTIDEPWMHSYFPIFQDIVTHHQVKDNLRRQAKRWRGVSALSDPPFPPGPFDKSPVVLSTPPSPSQTSIRPLPHSSFSHPILSSHTNPSVLPPSYAVHTVQSIPSSKFITPYTSTIIPSSAYLSDPLNAYAHHGMPKPFVHLFGPPLDVALDARITGNEARFVRSGCRPNAVLRPVICPRARGDVEYSPTSKCADPDMLTFGVFALRDIKANEEVVLGWEWDDGNAVHHLPALIETPHLFEVHHINRIRSQMASMLHALSSTFTTCACGSKAKDCALNLMAEFVDGRLPTSTASLSQRPDDSSGVDKRPLKIDLGPLVGAQRGFRARERSPLNGGMNGVELISRIPAGSGSPGSRDALSKGRHPPSSKIKGKSPVVQVISVTTSQNLANDLAEERRTQVTNTSPPTTCNQSEEKRAQDVTNLFITPEPSPSARGHDLRGAVGVPMYRSPSPSDSDPQPHSENEEQMPLRMRKRWIHRSTEGLRSASPCPSPSSSNDSLGSVLDEGQMGLESSDAKDMPPPPMPANLDPTTVSSIPLPNSPRVFTSKLSSLSPFSSAQLPSPQASPSPSTPFANLSLLSPTASYSSNSSPLSPKLSTLSSSLLSTISTSSPDAESSKPMQMDVDKNPPNSDFDPCLPSWDIRSPSLQTLAPSEPLRRVQSPPKNQVTSPSPVSTSRPSLAAPESLVDSDSPLAQSPPLVTSKLPPSPPPPPPVAKVKMSLKDFAMRKKKQREEERARAAAQPPEPAGTKGGYVGCADSDLPIDAASNLSVTYGAGQAIKAEVATATAPTEFAVAMDDGVREPTVLRGPIDRVDSESTNLYHLPQINGVHFDTSLASTLVEIAHTISPGRGCQLQDNVGAVKGSTPLTHGVICNGDGGGHLNSVSPRSSRTPSPSLTESEDGEAGGGMTRGMPPTQPRSFAVNASPVHSSNPHPHRLPPSSTYRPGSSYIPPSIPPSVRPLPSGPRALRAGMGGRGYPPGHFAGVPRGPSVDRDRDRGWAGVARGRGRGTTSSWGR